jgi:putative membrane protein insertion efficiency factor|tara:strand:+ start:126 stop:383 length:258 start_codon:yes stop_codon:yes gene_type:complete
MISLIKKILISIIKIYKFLISPFLGSRCRYIPSCSEYFIESLKTHNIIKALFYGFKRILKCHPIKLLGGGSGLDLVPKKKETKNG